MNCIICDNKVRNPYETTCTICKRLDLLEDKFRNQEIMLSSLKASLKDPKPAKPKRIKIDGPPSFNETIEQYEELIAWYERNTTSNKSCTGK